MHRFIALIPWLLLTTPSGVEAIYVNGSRIYAGSGSGQLSGWHADALLVLGNDRDSSPGRFWLGTYHLVAIYDRALTEEEVLRNRWAGSDPELEGR
jgi:hypothetical protein